MINEASHFEKKEQPASGRVEIYIVRHGKQEQWSDPNSDLSAEGAKQAEAFALEFLQDHLGSDKEAVIKIKRSPVSRAAKTGDVIAATLEREIAARGLQNLKLLNTRIDEDLKTTGSIGPLIKSGVAHDKVVDEWLANADNYENARKPQEIADNIAGIIADADSLAKKVSPDGPQIIYIMVTHETSHAALMNKLTGKSTEELGGGIGHLEPMRVMMNHDSQSHPVLSFRDQKYDLDLNRLSDASK